MLIQVNTDNHTDGTADLIQKMQALVSSKLQRFEGRITRVEVHLTDQDSAAKSVGEDKRCMIEVRMAGMDPISTTARGTTTAEAVRGSADKMKNQIETVLGKKGRS